MTENSRGSGTDTHPIATDDIDPRVAELVVAIRDRFGLRGLRGAHWLIEQEITLAEAAVAELPHD